MKGDGVTPGLGKRLKSWGLDKKMKGGQVSKIIRISQGSYSELESGKSLPSASTLENMILYTDLNIIWLLTGDKQ